jgi:hypothetical protein
MTWRDPAGSAELIRGVVPGAGRAVDMPASIMHGA